MKGISRYLGFSIITLMWVAFAVCLTMHSADLSEPISQYGYYKDTRLIFAVTCLAFGILYYIFSRRLDNYWKYTSRLSLVGSFFFALTGFIPYQPYARQFIFDAHNLSVTLAALCYSLPMLYISYSKTHKKIAQVSRYLFLILFVLIITSFIARIYDLGIFYFQLLAILPFHIWIISTNTLLLEHQKEAMDGADKL